MENRAKSTGIVVSFLAVVFMAGLAQMRAADRDAGDVAGGNIVKVGVLDGRKFVGPTGEKGKKTHHEDVLSFSDGIFTSSGWFE